MRNLASRSSEKTNTSVWNNGMRTASAHVINPSESRGASVGPTCRATDQVRHDGTLQHDGRSFGGQRGRWRHALLHHRTVPR